MLAERQKLARRTLPARVTRLRDAGGRAFVLREATDTDASRIRSLYAHVYGEDDLPEFVEIAARLRGEINDPDGFLWLVAEEKESGQLVATLSFLIDAENRVSKLTGAVCAEPFRPLRIVTYLLEEGMRYLTRESGTAQLLYATTRTVRSAPAGALADAGFRQMGLFPGAVDGESREPLNLDVLFTEEALSRRRRKPYLYPPLADVYAVARKQLKLERPYLVTERPELELPEEPELLYWTDDEAEAAARYEGYLAEGRLCATYLPFHRANRILTTEDLGTEIFVWTAGAGLESAILGLRTDRRDRHALLNAAAASLAASGVGSVSLLVDAYDYRLQQEAFTARFLPAAYFPAFRLCADGMRDDCFLMSRPFFRVEDEGSAPLGDSLAYFRAYLRWYRHRFES